MSKTGTIDLTQPFVKSLVAKLDKAEGEVAVLRTEIELLHREKKVLADTLQDLYDASPASPDSDSLCQAQLAAEKVLGL